MRQPSRQKISNEMRTNRLLQSEIDEDESLLAIIRGEFQERRVDWKLRNQQGTLQQACNYYYEDDLLHSGDWFRFEFVDINESGDTICFSDLHGGGEMPLADWVETAAEGYLEDELGEIWNDVKMMYDH